MKKRLIALICAAIAVVPCFCGCSCSSMDALSFINAFNGGADSATSSAPSVGYTETLVYDVKYVDSGEKGYFEKDESLKDLLTIESYGTYASVLEVISSVPKDIVKSDIDCSADTAFYKLTTDLTITAKYVSGGKEYNHEDYVRSTTYFRSCSFSFAPLYSKTESCYTMVYSNGKEAPKIDLATFFSEISYNKEEYSVTTAGKAFNHGEEQPALDDAAQTKSYKYQSRRVIDNAQLLFILRNASIAEGSSITLPVVSAGYGEYKNLTVTNSSNTQRTVTINGKEDKMPVSNISYSINEKNASGETQTVAVQNAATENNAYKALLVLYTEPLIVQNSATKIGTLEYTVKEVTIK